MMIFIVLDAALDLTEYKCHTHPTKLVDCHFLETLQFSYCCSSFAFPQHEIQSLTC